MSNIKLLRLTNGQAIELQRNSAGVLCGSDSGDVDVGDWGSDAAKKMRCHTLDRGLNWSIFFRE